MMVTSANRTLRTTLGVCNLANAVVQYPQKTPQKMSIPQYSPNLAYTVTEDSGSCKEAAAKKIPEHAQARDETADTLPKNELSDGLISLR